VAAGALAAATLIATVQKNPFADPLMILLTLIGSAALVISLIAGIPDLASWIAGGFRTAIRPARRPPRLETGRWAYTSDAVNAIAAANALEVPLPGTGYMRPAEDRPPWIRYAILVSCSPAGTGVDARQARARFMALLSEPPMADLVSALATTTPGDAVWTKRAAHGSSTFDAVLTPDGDDDAIASARLELPDGTSRFGRDPRCAAFILHIEPRQDDASPIPPASPDEWARRITQVLQAAPAIAGFLTGQLGLHVTGNPAAQAAVRLETPKDLAQLIDTAGLEPLPGGTPAPDTAARMIQHVLQYALKIDV
jgi:hypothetical protein